MWPAGLAQRLLGRAGLARCQGRPHGPRRQGESATGPGLAIASAFLATLADAHLAAAWGDPSVIVSGRFAGSPGAGTVLALPLACKQRLFDAKASRRLVVRDLSPKDRPPRGQGRSSVRSEAVGIVIRANTLLSCIRACAPRAWGGPWPALRRSAPRGVLVGGLLAAAVRL